MTPVLPGQDVHADLAGRPALLQEACERALAYLDGLAGRPVAPAADAVAALGRLDFALPGSDHYKVEIVHVFQCDHLSPPLKAP